MSECDSPVHLYPVVDLNAQSRRVRHIKGGQLNIRVGGGHFENVHVIFTVRQKFSSARCKLFQCFTKTCFCQFCSSFDNIGLNIFIICFLFLHIEGSMEIFLPFFSPSQIKYYFLFFFNLYVNLNARCEFGFCRQ